MILYSHTKGHHPAQSTFRHISRFTTHDRVVVDSSCYCYLSDCLLFHWCRRMTYFLVFIIIYFIRSMVLVLRVGRGTTVLLLYFCFVFYFTNLQIFLWEVRSSRCNNDPMGKHYYYRLYSYLLLFRLVLFLIFSFFFFAYLWPNWTMATHNEEAITPNSFKFPTFMTI